MTAPALSLAGNQANAPAPAFGPDNPFYAESSLPFQAPPFDKIKDSDYQPAIEAGIAQQQEEIRAIASNPDQPTFNNTFVALERSGQLLHRVMAVFEGVSGANTNDTLQKVEEIETPKLTALRDSIFLDAKLFAAGLEDLRSSATPLRSLPRRNGSSSTTTTASCTREPNSPTPTRPS